MRSSWGEHLQQSGVFNNPHEAFEGGTWYFRPRRLQPYHAPSAAPSSLGRTAADAWDECAGCPVSLGSYLWCALNHNSPAAAYDAERDLRGEPGAQPLDFVIIHWPKSLPPARHAIFITPAECIFPPLHCGTEPLLGIYAGNSFSHLRPRLETMVDERGLKLSAHSDTFHVVLVFFAASF